MKSDDFTWFLDFVKKLKKINSCSITCIDNPGFSVKINLKDSQFEQQTLARLFIERSEHDWIDCSAENEVFEGACGPTNLSEMLSVFRSWIENETVREESEILNKLSIWYTKHCNGDWEHGHGINIYFISESECHLQIHLEETEYSGKEIEFKSESESFVQDDVFNTLCSLDELPEAINNFLKWADQFTDEFWDILGSVEHFENISFEKRIIEEISIFTRVLEGKTIRKIICFNNFIHFVLDEKIYFNLFSKIRSTDLFLMIGSVLTKIELDYPLLIISNLQGCNLEIDLSYTFQGSPVRIELHAPLKYALPISEWTEEFSTKTWVLYV